MLGEKPAWRQPADRESLVLWIAWTAACAVGGTLVALASPFLAEVWIACFGLATSSFIGLFISLPQWVVLRCYAAVHAPVWIPTTVAGTVFGYTLGAGFVLFALAVLVLTFPEESSSSWLGQAATLLAVILGGALAGAVLGRLQWNALEDQQVSKRAWIAASCLGGVLYGLAFASQSLSELVQSTTSLMWSVLTVPYVLRMTVAALLYGAVSGYALAPLTTPPRRVTVRARPLPVAHTNGHTPPSNGRHM